MLLLIHNLVQQWKKKLQESASDVFMSKAERKVGNKPYTEDDLMKKIGRQTVVLLRLRLKHVG